jgi:hypothetical protein
MVHHYIHTHARTHARTHIHTSFRCRPPSRMSQSRHKCDLSSAPPATFNTSARVRTGIYSTPRRWTNIEVFALPNLKDARHAQTTQTSPHLLGCSLDTLGETASCGSNIRPILCTFCRVVTFRNMHQRSFKARQVVADLWQSVPYASRQIYNHCDSAASTNSTRAASVLRAHTRSHAPDLRISLSVRCKPFHALTALKWRRKLRVYSDVKKNRYEMICAYCLLRFLATFAAVRLCIALRTQKTIVSLRQTSNGPNDTPALDHISHGQCAIGKTACPMEPR